MSRPRCRQGGESCHRTPFQPKVELVAFSSGHLPSMCPHLHMSARHRGLGAGCNRLEYIGLVDLVDLVQVASGRSRCLHLQHRQHHQRYQPEILHRGGLLEVAEKSVTEMAEH